MRIINKIAYLSAKGLQEILHEKHEKRNVYYYGFQLVFGEASKVILLLLIGKVLNILLPMGIITLTFALIRINAGGYHMKTLGRCTIATLGLFVAEGLVVKVTGSMITNQVAVITMIIAYLAGMIVTWMYVPAENRNREIDAEGKSKFKEITFISVNVWFVVISLCVWLGWYVMAVASAVGLITEMLTVTPGGYRLLEKIDGV